MSDKFDINTMASIDNFIKFMTNEEIEESGEIIGIVSNGSDEMDDIRQDIEDYDVAYNGEQEETEGRPNTRVNIIHPNIEGQVAEIALQEIGVFIQGQEYTDEQFAEWARADIDWTIEHQDNLKAVFASAVRRMLKYGWTFLKVDYNPNKFNEFGLAEISSPYVDRVFVDRKITSPLDIQKAEYIAEVFSCSRDMAIQIYGQEKADAIPYGEVDISERSIFTNIDYNTDDKTSWVLIQFWNRTDGKLRLREYTSSGLLLYDSMKEGDRKSNQKNAKMTNEPIYKYVDNNYPYFMVNCYEEEGKLHGFGDIKLLENLQDALNNMYDNIRQATRPNRLLVDSRTDITPELITDDVFTPLLYDGGALAGNNPVHEVSFGGANPEWWRIIGNLHTEIQRVIRYSELMLGQSGGAGTATEAAIQERQGSRSTSMKQKMFEAIVKQALLYCLGLDLQFKNGKKAMRLYSSSKLEWVDYDLLKSIPVTVPMEQGERQKWIKDGYQRKDIPKTQILMKNGKPVTRQIEVDLKVTLGSKAPASPALIANMMTQFAAIQLLDKEGKPRPVIYWEEFRKFVSEYFQLPVEEMEQLKEALTAYEAEMAKASMGMAMGMGGEQQAQQGGGALPAIGTPANLSSGGSASGGAGVMQGKADFEAVTQAK